MPSAPQTTENIHRHVYSNGLILLVQEDHAHPLVALNAVIRTGSASEGDWLGTGVSHVVEHMLFKGTERRDVGQFSKEIRSYGGNTQGYTSFDTTSYPMVVNQEYWTQAADLLIDSLFFASIDEGEFLKEREVILRELKMRADNPGQKVWDKIFSTAYTRHPYRLPIIGYEEQLKAMTADDVLAYHRLHYIPNNMVLAVVGAVDTEQVVEAIGKLVETIEPGKVPIHPEIEEPMPVSPRKVVAEEDIQLASAAVAFPSITPSDPDLYALDLLSWVLGGGRGSMLDRAIKETGIVHVVGAWNYTPKSPGLFGLTMRLEPENMDAAFEGVWEQIALAKSGDIPQRLIDAGKRTLLRDFYAQRQSVGEIAGDLSSYEVLVGDPLFSKRYLEGMQAVTLEDLKRVANQYLIEEVSTMVQLYPRGTRPTQEDVVEASQESDVEVVTLDSGVRVVFKPSKRVPLVSVQAVVLGGIRFETEADNGISGMTASMLMRGTEQKTSDELVDAIKALGIAMGPMSGRNSFGLSFEGVSTAIEPAFDLFFEVLLQPTFPAEELEKERELALAGLKASEEEPFPWGMRRLFARLYEAHPYRLDPAGTEASVSALTREQLQAFYKRVLQPQQLVLTVVGDYDRDAVLNQIQSALAGLGGGQPNVDVPEEGPLQGRQVVQEVTPRKEGLLLIGFRGLALEDERLPALDVLDSIMSGGSGRLFVEIRDKKGLVYVAGMSAIHGLEPGALVFYALADPGDLDAVQDALFEEIERLRTEPVSEEELQIARQGILGDRRTARQSQAGQGMQLALNTLYGLGVDYDVRYEAALKAVTQEDVQALAQVLLDPERCVIVIGAPADTDIPAEQPVS